MKSFREFLKENYNMDNEPFEMSWGLTKHYDCAVLTAYLDTLTEEENYKRLSQLKALLIGEGYNVIEIEGSYLEFEKYREQEKQILSLFVVEFWNSRDNTLINDCLKLANKFDQQSFLHITNGGETIHLVGAGEEDDLYPAYGDKVDFIDSEYVESLKNMG